MPPIDPFFLTPQDSPAPDDRTCSSCGYDLRGIATNRPCPECGQIETPPTVSPSAPGVDSEGDSHIPSMPATGGLLCPRCGVSTSGLPIGALCPTCAAQTPGRSTLSDGAQHTSTDECVSCGYDLRAAMPGTPCPECGVVSMHGGMSMPDTMASQATGALRSRSVRDVQSRKLPPRVAGSMVFRGGIALLLLTAVALIAAGVLLMMRPIAQYLSGSPLVGHWACGAPRHRPLMWMQAGGCFFDGPRDYWCHVGPLRCWCCKCLDQPCSLGRCCWNSLVLWVWSLWCACWTKRQPNLNFASLLGDCARRRGY